MSNLTNLADVAGSKATARQWSYRNPNAKSQKLTRTREQLAARTRRPQYPTAAMLYPSLASQSQRLPGSVSFGRGTIAGKAELGRAERGQLSARTVDSFARHARVSR
jgi:hypothetical protein